MVFTKENNLFGKEFSVVIFCIMEEKTVAQRLYYSENDDGLSHCPLLGKPLCLTELSCFYVFTFL